MIFIIICINIHNKCILGKSPNPVDGTYVEIVVSDADEPKQWGAKIRDKTANYLTVTIFTPPTLYVGKWGFQVDILKSVDGERTTFRYNSSQPIYILFNPWCKGTPITNVYCKNKSDIVSINQWGFLILLEHPVLLLW